MQGQSNLFFQQSTVEYDEIWRVWEIKGYQVNVTPWIMSVNIPRRERHCGSPNTVFCITTTARGILTA